MTGKRGPLGFGDEPERPPGEPADGPPDTPPGEPPDRPRGEPAAGPARQPDEPWLPGGSSRDDPDPGRARSRLPGILLIGACFALLVVVALNTLRTEGGSSSGPSAGTQIPPFAAPLVLSDEEGDVNLAREPDQGAAGSRPACEVRREGVITSCALVRGRPAVIAFFADGEKRCVDQLDVLATALRDHPGIAAMAVAVRGDRDDLRILVQSRDWRFPVAQDRDGGMANVYGVAVCPQMTFVLPGGRVQESTVGELDARELDRQLDRLQSRAGQSAAQAPAGEGGS